MNRRVVPIVAACLTSTVFTAMGVRSLVLPAVFVGIAGLVLAWGRVRSRRAPSAPDAWQVGASGPSVTHTPGSARAVVAALGRGEARELALGVWFGVGVGFLAVIGVVFVDDAGSVWTEMFSIIPWLAHPLAGMLIIAAHRATTRPGRDGTDELFESCPTEPMTRAWGVMASAVLPLALFAAFLVVFELTVLVRNPELYGPIPIDVAAGVASGLVLVVGAVCLGVALGSWFRFGLVPAIAVVAIGFLSIRLALGDGSGWQQTAGLSTLGPQDKSPLVYSVLPHWPGLVWLVALTVVVVALTALRFDRGRVVWLGALGAVSVAVIAALVATAPVEEAEAQRIADRVLHPADHQECAATDSGRIDVCTYGGHDELRERVLDALEPVGAALPAGVTAITVREGIGADIADLPPEVRRRLGRGSPAPGATDILLGSSADAYGLQEARLLVAFASLGTDLDRDRETPLAIDGEARGVVALWLASRGLSSDDALDTATVDTEFNQPRDEFERGLVWPVMCGPVVWSSQDLAAARAVMRSPEAEVGEVVRASFARWSDLDTGTDDLLEALGLASEGPYDSITPRRERFC